MKLEICSNKNEKGIDARDKKGVTYEIKTRRVYESERRNGETRRLNNLDGKSANYLIVVALDRKFECSGMWLIPYEKFEKSKICKFKNCKYYTRN